MMKYNMILYVLVIGYKTCLTLQLHWLAKYDLTSTVLRHK